MVSTSLTAVAAVALVTVLPVAVRTLGWLLGLRLVLKASKPGDRAALLVAFAPISVALHRADRVEAEPQRNARRRTSG
jgi:hypothetical protein